jgi:cytidine deaminase
VADHDRDPADLDVDDRELLEAARACRHRSHVPFSGFSMGAAVRGATGAVTPGVVVENVVFPTGLCAERVALTGALAAGAGQPMALALVAPRTRGSITWPCGACLQLAVELAGPDLRVVVADPDLRWSVATLGELAPRLPRSAHRPD